MGFIIILSNKIFIILINIAMKNGTNQPSTIKCVPKNNDATFKTNIFTIGYKTPKDDIVIGSVNHINTGLIVAFNMLITKDANKAYHIFST